MKQSSKGVIAILLSSVFWSFTGVFSRFLLTHGFSAVQAVVGIFAFREIPGVIGFTGIAVVIIGIILLEYHKAKNINN